MPLDLSGRSVLAVGPVFDAVCAVAHRRGAGRILGIDADPRSVRQAHLQGADLPSRVEFRCLDLERDRLAERFDHVICLNTVQHVRDPIGFLHILGDLARGSLVVEIARLSIRPQRGRGWHSLVDRFLERYALVMVGGDTTSGGPRFLANRRAVENLLTRQRSVFSGIVWQRSPIEGRSVCVAAKRRIERLVVVAAPTSGGKSTLIELLTAGELPEIARLAGIEGATECEVVGARSLGALNRREVDTLILHYDILRPWTRHVGTPHRDEALEVVEVADHVVFLTLWTPPGDLRQQLEEGEIRPHTQGGAYWGSARHMRVREAYEDDAGIIEFYDDWFEHCRARPGCHYIVTLRPAVEVHPLEAWPALSAQARAGTRAVPAD